MKPITDNQGRPLLVLPTTMRLAFADALQVAIESDREDTPNDPAIMVFNSLKDRKRGYLRVPTWTVTRRAKPKGRR